MSKNQIQRSSLNRGRIFLCGEINESQVHRLAYKIRYIFFDLNITNIYIYIHSDGGDFESACAIIDEIIGFGKLGANVCTIACGKACSAAALILAVGTERYATPNTTIMLHQIHCSRDLDTLNNIKIDMAFTDRQYREVMELVAKRCGCRTKVKIDDFVEQVDKVSWLLPKDAQKMGIIDGIWNYEWEKLDEANN